MGADDIFSDLAPGKREPARSSASPADALFADLSPGANTPAGSNAADALFADLQPPKPTRNTFARANDTVIEAANATAGLAKAGSDLIAPGNRVSQGIDHFIEAGQERQSDFKKDQRRRLAQDLEAAPGEFAKAGTYLRHAVKEDPLGTVGQALGNIGPFAALGKAVQGANVATRTGVTMGAAGGVSAGEVRGNIFERITDTPDNELRAASTEYAQLRETMSEEDAKSRIATSFERHAPEILATGAFGALGGRYGLEGMAARVAPNRGRIAGAAIGVLDEASQGAFEQVASNVGVRRTLPDQRLDEDVALNAAAEGILGLAGGIAATPRRNAVPPGMTDIGPTPSEALGIDPTAGPISRAAVTAVDQVPTDEPVSMGMIPDTAPTPDFGPFASAVDGQSPVPLESAQRLAAIMADHGRDPVIVPNIDETGFGVAIAPSLAPEQRAALARFQPTPDPESESFDTPRQVPLFPFERAGAERIARAWSERDGIKHVVIPHPSNAGRFAVVRSDRPEAAAALPVSPSGPDRTTAPLDHGVLNIKGRTDTIDAELDAFRNEQQRATKAKTKAEVTQRRADRAQAKGMLELHGEQIVARHGERFGGKALRAELKRMATWQPRDFIKLVERFQSETESGQGNRVDPTGERVTVTRADGSIFGRYSDRRDAEGALERAGAGARIIDPDAAPRTPDPAAIRTAIEQAEARTATTPTEAQKDAGNYAKGKVDLHGQRISIETPKGAERTGTDARGKRWSVTVPVSYGYFLGTKANDGDHVDVFLGPAPDSGVFWVVNQTRPGSRTYDEPKVMLGFDSARQAQNAFRGSFAGEFSRQVFGNMVGPFSVAQLDTMLATMGRNRPVSGAVAIPGRMDNTTQPADVQPQETRRDEQADPYDGLETRPGTTEAQRKAGRSALQAIVGRLNVRAARQRGDNADRGAITVLGARLTAGFQAEGGNKLIGQKVDGAEDLATLAQVYRDPRFETFRVFYTRGETIVGEAGYSNRLPAAVYIPPDLTLDIRRDLKAFEADGYFILHNHPSGRSKPSDADVRLTKDIARLAPGMRAHVVINSNEYSTINHRGSTNTVAAPQFEAVDFTAAPEIENELLGAKISSATDVALIGQTLKTSDQHGTVIFTRRDGTVQLIADVPLGHFRERSNRAVLKLQAAVRRLARAAGAGGHRFLVVPDSHDASDFSAFMRKGVFRDIVQPDGAAMSDAGVQAGRDFLDKRTKDAFRVSEGEKPYSKRDPAYADITPEQEAALRHVGLIREPKTWRQRFEGITADLAKRLTQGLVDQFHPLKELDDRAYILARMSRGTDGTLEALMFHGTPVVKGDTLSADTSQGGFMDLMSSLNGEQDRFLHWIAANRADSIMRAQKGAEAQARELRSEIRNLKAMQSEATEQGDRARIREAIDAAERMLSDAESRAAVRELLFTPEQIETLKGLNRGQMRSGKSRVAEYRRALKRFNEIQDSVMEIAEARGIIDAESRQVWKDGFYVPFYRNMEDGTTGPSVRSGLVNQYAFKRLKGSKRQLNEDLMANVLKNWAHLLDASAKNHAAVASIDAAIGAGIAEQVPSGTKGAVKALRNGAEQHYLISDPFIFDALTAMEGVKVIGIEKALGKFKHILTAGVTMNPAFQLRSLIRDSLHSLAVTPIKPNPATNVATGLRELTRRNKSQTYVDALVSGGLIRFNSLLEGDRAEHTRRLIKMGVEDRTILDTPEKVKQAFTRFVRGWQEVGNVSESTNRMAMYQQLIENGMDPLMAAYHSRDLIDYSMQGQWRAVRFLTMTVPFLNARMQGLYKIGRDGLAPSVRTLIGKNSETDKQLAKRFGAVTGSVAMASILLMLAYRDDEDWKKREDWDRDFYWWFKVPGTDTAFRIPKPFEVGAIGTLAERTVELMLEDEMTGKRFASRLSHMLAGTFSLNPTPQALKPLLDVYANKDSFTGRAIEGMGMERLQPADRYTAHTSEIAKALGGMGIPDPFRLVGGEYSPLSPVQVDALIRGYFSWLGTSATRIVDEMVRTVADRPPRPERQLRDWFFVGNFIEELPANSSRYLTHMYEQSRSIEQAWGSYRAAVGAGDSAVVRRILESDASKLSAHPTVVRAKRQVGDMNRAIRMIHENPHMSARDKRDRIDAIRQRQHAIAQQISRHIN